jgi:hypothetical protein
MRRTKEKTGGWRSPGHGRFRELGAKRRCQCTPSPQPATGGATHRPRPGRPVRERAPRSPEAVDTVGPVPVMLPLSENDGQHGDDSRSRKVGDRRGLGLLPLAVPVPGSSNHGTPGAPAPRSSPRAPAAPPRRSRTSPSNTSRTPWDHGPPNPPSPRGTRQGTLPHTH